ncbi:MAG: methionyl-tRNA formyltransferase [Oscillospiraceae bacterium]|nr:methionyl-tRNA formyltransferase [Oscillospiraceae bacterium]
MNERIIFMGTPRLASVVLERLHDSGFRIVACFTQPDKPVGRKMQLTPPPVKVTAETLGIPVFQPNRMRDESVLIDIGKLHPDMIVTAAYGKILPPSILGIPAFGCLNVHGSLLPQYRGAAPIQWAILNGESETGVTVMLMDEGIDNGPMLRSASIPIGPEESAPELTERLAELGADLIVRTIPEYIRGEISPIPQNDEFATFAPLITKEQGLIDWNDPANKIHNQIRGLAEWPGAYSEFKGKRVKIYRSSLPNDPDSITEAFRETGAELRPGTVVCARKDVLAVMCGDIPLLLRCIQPESCKRLEACECAHNFAPSDHFGGEK